MTPVRVRFAPSPTGYLHIGGVRTALFDYLLARHTGGTFVLRIEDTDRSRYEPNACREIYESLRWLGLEWDEGPEVGGPHAPYVQSERTALYREHAEKLLDSGHAYRCFCTPERLAEVRAEQEKAKSSKVGYDRHCRDLDEQDVRRLVETGTPYVVRFRIPPGRKVGFEDAIRGAISYRTDVLEDQVLLKSDGFPTYHLASVVDDREMAISHVLRGEEWIASTPLHLLMYEAFGWEPPVFAHVPVILSKDGGKLSKRKGAMSALEYRAQGFLPDAMVNFLALVGWAPGDDREKMSREELIEAFSLERVSPKAAVLDEQKLEWLNGQYLAELPVEAVAEQVVGEWRERGWVDAGAGADEPRLRTIVELMKARCRKVTDIAPNAAYFFVDPEEYEEKAARKHFGEGAEGLLGELAGVLEKTEPFEHQGLEEAYRVLAEGRGMGAGKVIHPTRLAVSGVSFGPGLFEMLEVLGRQTVVRRIRRAQEWLRERRSS